jgi:hypothetical protein
VTAAVARYSANLDEMCKTHKDQEALPLQDGFCGGAPVTVRCVLERTAVVAPQGNEAAEARTLVRRTKVWVDPDEYLFSRDPRAMTERQRRRRGQQAGRRVQAARKAG